MIGLSLDPTFLMGVNKDLKMPKGFVVKSNVKKSTFDYPQIKKLDENLKVNLYLTLGWRQAGRRAQHHKESEGQAGYQT